LKKTTTSSNLRELSSRKTLKRLSCICTALKSDQKTNATQLAKQFKVSTKTIQRDIKSLREDFGLPIRWAVDRYMYAGDVDSFPLFHITEDEIVALLVAQKALESYQGNSFQQPMSSLLDKFSSNLKYTDFISLDYIEPPISFKPSSIFKVSIETFETILIAVNERQELRFSYSKGTSTDLEVRHVQPYHLRWISHHWYLECFDLVQRERRTFKLIRMTELMIQPETFKLPTDFEIKQGSESAFGTITGDAEHTVLLEFKGQAAEIVEESIWHPTQTSNLLPDGRLEVSMTLSDLTEIERWILSWGGQIKVIKPPELKKRIRDQAQSILDNN
jgi:predicted DNA-binding transcriptional regulator YafY